MEGISGFSPRDSDCGYPLCHQVVQAGYHIGKASPSIPCCSKWTRPTPRYVIAFCDGGYTTNLPLDDVLGGKAWVVYIYEGQPLAPEHGGPARLLVPHLYFWKSAKWVRGLRLVEQDEPGFWESLGYHNHGDPWKEERYWGD